MKVRKRPTKLVVPEFCASLELYGNERKLERKEFEVEGRDFLLACKRGRREVMEDGYGFMLDIHGDPKQAFFTVIDGHGGRAAAEYVAGNLGRNIVKELGNVGDEGIQLEQAMRGVTSGACTASVLLKDSELHVANAGDCRVVLSRNGVADSLTKDHRLSREDERSRIENAGAFVHFCNGAWRVQGSLAVSRAIGDLQLKEWIISEPETKRLSLTSDCEFLIMASDGLWDKVNAQEAVDVVSRNKSSMESCKNLIDISSSRGNMDDITVMVINLDKFVPKSH
ncbi:protein-serine/threonine phosphatase [Citrus sinensis]|uniref:Protein-serine/threonine phosphatase n=1 Tax=Citrus sinensis TaxID=2711 RepID=A0ACB8M874_CITSI|nr:protein-serine/threonine phosphatase [Citrus sinensis]